jgi:DNA-binding CsgD family transcriptional regulator
MRRPRTERAVLARIELRAPAGVQAWRLDVPGEEMALLAWPVAPRPLPPALTAAEAEVSRLLVAGLSYAAIARARGTSPRTVANQAASVYRKLGVGSRDELEAWLAGG